MGLEHRGQRHGVEGERRTEKERERQNRQNIQTDKIYRQRQRYRSSHEVSERNYIETRERVRNEGSTSTARSCDE